jgi:Competence protein CoiA-like family
MTTILYTVATDKNGNLIKANDAEKGDDFFCPVCNSDLILRKSGNTGKGSKRPHFAHRSLTPNCTPETALHYSFKNLLAKKIDNYIQTSTPLLISWGCQYCGVTHTGNLLKKIKSVKVEYYLSVCKPDIALIDNDNKVFAVIEVVVTHKPEENVINFYNDNDIILIQVNLTSDKDIDDLEIKISQPDIVSTCYNPKCKTCGQFQQKKVMTIIDGPCWKCGTTMKVATISSSNGGLVRGSTNNLSPSEFTDDEITFAQSKGVLLKTQYSKTVNEKYVANSCNKCGTFAGDHYLFTQYVAPASYGELPSETFDIGYLCEYCEEGIEIEDDDY